MATKTFTQFRVDNVVTTLPTTLSYGQEVYYKDSNGNLTLWVGHEDGTAWPVCGYKEYVALLTQTSTSAPTATVLKNEIGTISYSYASEGAYSATSSGLFPSGKTVASVILYSVDPASVLYACASFAPPNEIGISTFGDEVGANGLLSATPFSIRIYP